MGLGDWWDKTTDFVKNPLGENAGGDVLDTIGGVVGLRNPADIVRQGVNLFGDSGGSPGGGGGESGGGGGGGGEEGGVEISGPSEQELAMFAAAEEYYNRSREIMDTNFERGTEIWDYWVDTYRGPEKSLARALFAGVDPDQAITAAVSDVGQQFNVARGIQQRELARVGISPTSGRSQALGQRASLAEAAERAGASNLARRQVSAENEQRKLTATDMGRRLIPLSQSFTGQGLQAGQSGFSAMQAPASLMANRSMNQASIDAAASEAAANRAFSAEQAAIARAENARLTASQNKSNLYGSIFGAIGTGIGLLGGPAGAAAGGAAGNAIGGSLSGGSSYTPYRAGGYTPGSLFSLN